MLTKMVRVLLSISALFAVAPVSLAADPAEQTRRFFHHPPHISSLNSPVTAATCLSAVVNVPVQGQKAIDAAKEAAQALLDGMLRISGRVGWTLGNYTLSANCGVPGSYRPFDRKECNPTTTFYAYYNALAMLCLSRVGRLTGDRQFTDAAKASAEYWVNIGTKPTDCVNCWWFWTSDARLMKADMSGTYLILWGERSQT